MNDRMAGRIANILTIAGSDSGGGAGIQADLKTFSALGTYGLSVISALTAQNTRAVTAIHNAPPEMIGAQLDAVFEDIRIDAVKIGMLSRPEVIEVVADRLQRYRVTNAVLDPVMVAKSGDTLLQREAVSALIHQLLPLALIVTPNLPEAGVLLGRPPPADLDAMGTAAVDLLALGPKAVLLKGGHLQDGHAVDVFHDGSLRRQFESERFSTNNTHGTGCTLSAAIAAKIGQGFDLPTAARMAKDYISRAIAAADELEVGKGHGPVHHFHALWPGGGEGDVEKGSI